MTLPVLVTTEHRGVFFGHLSDDQDRNNKASLTLTDVRCAIYWSGIGGFLSLAAVGPTSECRIGTQAPRVTLHDITSVSDCTEKAAKAWRSA